MRHADPPANRRHVDDSSPAILPHRRNGCEHGVQRAPEMHRHRLFEILHLHVLERTNLDDAGVVDEHIDAAGALDHFLNEPFRVVANADVAHRDLHVGAARAELFAGPFELPLIPAAIVMWAPSSASWRATSRPEPSRSASDHHGPSAEINPPRRPQSTGNERTAKRKGAGSYSSLLSSCHPPIASKIHTCSRELQDCRMAGLQEGSHPGFAPGCESAIDDLAMADLRADQQINRKSANRQSKMGEPFAA